MYCVKRSPSGLIFDRVECTGVLRAETLADGSAYVVGVLNVGDGCPDAALVRVEVSGTALALLTCPVQEWLRESVERIANSHQNDGEKVAALVARGPLQLDSRYVFS
jgi:hypothetical protein